MKVKNIRTQEAWSSAGWTNRERATGPEQIGALLMGMPSAEGLRYVGKVGSGLSAAET